MIGHALRAAEGQSAPLDADGSVLDVLMLQLHVVLAGAWLLTCLLVALLAVPRLRRIPSVALLHALQVRRELVLGALWATFVLTLGTGTYLMFQQAAYDPPLSGSDFDALELAPYGLPYYYALYGKIALFLAMGVASLLLAMEANRAARRSEAAGGPAETDRSGELDWVEEEVLPGTADAVEIGAGLGADPGTEDADTRLAARPATLPPSVSIAGLWGSVAVLVAGAGGIAFCVTLIKYFHELSRAAVVYQRLRGG